MSAEPPARAAPDAVVRALDPAARAAAERWALRLGLPLVDAASSGGDASEAELVLEAGLDGLGLRAPGGPRVRVAPRELLERRGGGRDLLLRAVGALEPGTPVADATAGLGADAFRLAARGARVTMLERVPLVAALLEDALERAAGGREGVAAQRAAQRVTLLVGDARARLPALRPSPAVVLIDPMYPSSGKRSLPKKGMALFRSLVGADADAAEILDVALRVATARVVVKRPRRGAALGVDAGAPLPSGSVVGTTSRYDIYAPRRPGS